MSAAASFITDWQNSDETKMSFSRHKEKLSHINIMKHFSILKQFFIKPWVEMDKPYMDINKWKKPRWKGSILYNYNYMTL